jgi:hypothetical protein
VPYPSTPLK